jgi:chitodextrinase
LYGFREEYFSIIIHFNNNNYMRKCLQGFPFRRGWYATTLMVALWFGLAYTSNCQTIVYIDPTYMGGSNDGSSAHPYTSWANITTFTNNTSYLQKRGTTCNITSPIAIDEKTGITFGVYGTGTDYASINSTYRIGATVKIAASLNCTVNGFHFTADNFVPDPSNNGTYAVYVVDKEGSSATIVPNAGNIVIKNCLIEHSTWGIRIMEVGYSNLDGITVDSCTIQNIFWDGMFIQSWQGGDGIGGLHGVDLNHCYITNVNAAIKYYEDQGITPTQSNSGGDGIQISQYVQDWIIHNTTIDRRGSGLKFCIIHGDEQSTHKYGGTVENCTIYTPDRIIGGLRGTGCYFSILDTVNFRYNRVIGNVNSMGIQIRWNTNFNCYYNTFTGFTGTDPANYAVFDVQSDPAYTQAHQKIHNNTFYNNGSVYYYLAGSDAFDFKNNIFSSIGTVYVSSAGVTSDYNLYYPTPASGIETHSKYGQDPKLNAPASGDFRLQTGSPCINAGTNLGYLKDIAGTIINGNPDLGAYEYISFDTQAPTIPTGLTSSNVTYTGFTLSWTASSDNVGVTGYDVYKNGELISSVSGTTVTISGLTQGTTYAMTVKTKDGSGNISAASTPLNVTTTAASDAQAPGIPANLGTTRIGQGSFVLTWNASTDASNPVAYDVYKNGVLYTSVTTTSAVVSGVSAGSSYAMTVKARDIYNNTSAASAVYSVTTLSACTTTDPFTNSGFTNQTGTFIAELEVTPWGDFMNGVVGLSNNAASAFNNLACILQFDVDGLIRARNGSGYTAVNTMGYFAGVVYHVKFVVSLGTHTYDVFVTPAGGSQVTIASGYPFRTEQASVTQLNNYAKQTNSCTLTVANFVLNSTSDTQSPSVPSGLAVSSVTSTTFALSWTASTDNVAVTGYDVYKDGILDTTVTTSTATINNLVPGVPYAMTIKARDAAGNISAPSGTLNVTTTLGSNLALNKTAVASSVHLALNKTAVASSVLNDNTSFAASKAVDGNASATRWVSSSSASNWIYVDLGASYTISTVILNWTTTGYGRDYKIQVSSDGNTWTDIYTVTGNTSGGAKTYSFTPVSCRYVRMNGAALGQNVAQYNLWEFEVYGTLTKSTFQQMTKENEVSFCMIYPNPAAAQINIVVDEQSALQILGLDGRVYVQRMLEPGINRIEHGLRPGVYFVRITNSVKVVSTGKLIIR